MAQIIISRPKRQAQSKWAIEGDPVPNEMVREVLEQCRKHDPNRTYRAVSWYRLEVMVGREVYDAYVEKHTKKEPARGSRGGRAPTMGQTLSTLLVTKHERCVCGHCRCGHRSGFSACQLCGCARYTWPGDGADLPPDHAR